MSLDVKKLEKVADLADGVRRARCPACAEKGQDKKGEHLRITADGKFGCCVFPGDREHRKRIYALAGERGPRSIKVRVAAVQVAGPVRSGILGRLAQVFAAPPDASTYSTIGEPDAPDGVSEVESAKCGETEGRTPRTGEPKSDGGSEDTSNPLRTGRTGQTESNGELFDDSRTLRTPQLPLCVTEEDGGEENEVAKVKECCEAVRSVREGETAVEPPKPAESEVRLPFLTPGGTLSIPHDSPERYHWWKLDGERLHVREILAEVLARKEEVENGATF